MSMNDGSSRPRFMDTFKAALQPREPIQIDPDAPNPIPRTVKISGVMVVVAAVLTVATGCVYVFSRHALVQGQLDDIALCTTDSGEGVIGIGEAVAADATSSTPNLVEFCRSIITAPTSDDVSGWLSNLLTTGIALSVIGLILLISGLAVFRGMRIGRRVATTVGILILLGTMLGLFGSSLLLIAALLLLIALAMVYVGKGANYYIRAKAKGVK